MPTACAPSSSGAGPPSGGKGGEGGGGGGGGKGGGGSGGGGGGGGFEALGPEQRREVQALERVLEGSEGAALRERAEACHAGLFELEKRTRAQVAELLAAGRALTRSRRQAGLSIGEGGAFDGTDDTDDLTTVESFTTPSPAPSPPSPRPDSELRVESVESDDDAEQQREAEQEAALQRRLLLARQSRFLRTP
jgi:hypothetical protein